MLFTVLNFLSLLLLINAGFVASFDRDPKASELLSSFSGILEPNKDLPPEAHANDRLGLISSIDPTTTTGDEKSKSSLLQSENNKCPYNPNQPSSRRARSKRGEICVPPLDDIGQSVHASELTEPEKKNPQENAQPGDSPAEQKPLAPYKDNLLCPIPLAPWPVCGTVDSFYIHYQIIYPVTNAPMGWWIHEYCVPGMYLVSQRRALCD